MQNVGPEAGGISAPDELAHKKTVLPFFSHVSKGAAASELACLSQFYRASFLIGPRSFRTAEHYMMYAKAELFGDMSLGERILQAASAYEAMELGRSVAGFDEMIWESKRRHIVLSANLAKFSQNEACRRILSETQNSILAFASPVDVVWGTGYSYREHLEGNWTKWPGQNLLGEILMEVRQTVCRES